VFAVAILETSNKLSCRERAFAAGPDVAATVAALVGCLPAHHRVTVRARLRQIGHALKPRSANAWCFGDTAEQHAHLIDENPSIEEAQMPTFSDPVADADELREAVRGLAHATRSVDDPTEIYSVLGSLSQGLCSLEQAIHQLGDFHDGAALKRSWMTEVHRPGRASSYQVSWELHRAAEMIHQVAGCVDRAHEIEATIAYDIHDDPTLAAVQRSSRESGLSL
jgi:hypothetical protein